MKIITIFQENNEKIELTDNDNSDLENYTLQFKDLFESNEVIILETTSGNVIIRPHKINSILIIDDKLIKDEDSIQDSEDFIKG